jgi:hypothetical protein
MSKFPSNINSFNKFTADQIRLIQLKQRRRFVFLSQHFRSVIYLGLRFQSFGICFEVLCNKLCGRVVA